VTEPASQTVTKVLLVRHGQSVANAGGRTADHDTNPLTELGRAQARDFAGRLPCTPTLFVVSPFLRAQQTAEPLRQQFPDVPVEQWPVQEFTFLDPARHKDTCEEDRQPNVMAYWQRQHPAFIDGFGAESFTQFFDRARSDPSAGKPKSGRLRSHRHSWIFHAGLPPRGALSKCN
jgi:2,3-bisphosphoglycerate-dependent phosphoglycerate mutase